MKPIIYSILAMSGLAMVACSDDVSNSLVENNQTVEVSFTTELPSQLLSRAVSDGTTVDQLHYTVFKGSDAVMDITMDAFSGTSTTETIKIPLITGETYDLVFWADKKGDYYTYDEGVVTVNYTDASGKNVVKANDEEADAFFAAVAGFTVTGSGAQTVTLTRPFAQINFGTTLADYQAALKLGLDVTESSVAIKTQTYKTLKLLDGSVDGAVDEVVYASLATPTDTDNPFSLTDDNRAALTVDSKNYVYVAYAYVLTPPVDKAETITKVTLTPKATENSVREYASIPVKRNYRTNIIGNLFTSDLDWAVKIDADYETPDDNIEVVTFKGVGYKANYAAWDGTSVENPYTNAEGDIIIASAAQLAGFAAQTNGMHSRSGEGSTFENENIYLLVDVDLNNKEWTPIAADAKNAFSGYFHGQGRTISNLTVTKAEQVAGLFGWSHNCSIEYLGIQNANIDATNIATTKLSEEYGYGKDNNTGAAAVLLAHEVGTQKVEYDGIKNITINNAKIKSHHYAGGIVGCFQHWGAMTYIQNCNVSNLDINLEFESVAQDPYWDNADKAGGIVGQCGSLGNNGGTNYYLKIQNNTVNNLTLIGYRDLGGIIGGTNQNIHVLNNTVNNSTISVTVEHDYKNYGGAHNVGQICGAELTTMVISGNVANNVSVSMNLTATPETFGKIMKNITTDAVITLSEGEFTFGGYSSSPNVKDTFVSWDFSDYATHEDMETFRYDNLKEGINITLIGSGTDKTVFINSDGSNITGGGARKHIMVNKANITFKNMLEVVRHYSIIDATVETHEDCIILGEVDPRSGEVNYINCTFDSTPQSVTVNGKTYEIKEDFQHPLLYGMYSRYLNFTNCDFKANQNKAVQIYATKRPYVLIDITATDCTLYGGANNSGISKPEQRAFFEVHGDCSIHGNLTLNNCSINAADASNWGGGLVYDGPWTTTGDYYFTVKVDNDDSLNHNQTFIAPASFEWTGEYTMQ